MNQWSTIANWGWGRHIIDSNCTPTIYDRGLVEKRLFIHIYYFSWRVFDTHICHKVKVSIFTNFEISYEYILEGLVKLRWSNSVLWSNLYHHTIMCFARMMIKGILLHEWSRKFEFLNELFWNFKPKKWQGSMKLKHRLTCDYCAPCAKFEVIWTMVGELMVHK